MSARKGLPPEIIEAILRRLPAKSLGRFKSVSKPWRSLISNPEFIKTHLDLNNHHKTSILILVSEMKSFYSVSINELVPYLDSDDLCATGKEISFRPPSIRWEEILGSCNGLVLAKDEDDQIFLMNPTTQEVSELPISPFALPLGESFVMYGFGYDSSSDDYKVVSISFWDTDNEHNLDCTDMLVSVYSLRNNSWRKVHNSPYDHAVGHLLRGVLINESLHWLTQRIPGYSSTIVAFSLANEEFNEIELPDSIDNKKAMFNELVVLGGKLALFANQVGNDLWVMEEYDVGESWTKVSIHGVEIDPVKPVCSVDDNNRDIVLGDENRVHVYNLDDRRCRNVRILGAPTAFAVGGTYLESLVSPKLIITRTP
ncbi:F-box/kelch-repeat protein At3g06240-like [Cynara cardunculus var. scolymus]|uniref:F-box/kelch-repeat protein At3g06240-like n=1 Tax=Cynara cardunculus var. scolymus TaxID=59895 RepID=UPI000D62EE29|nr:F-box/kelch-repeat protein At3g06240-like [Cynara cardunculus var. scolymus]